MAYAASGADDVTINVSNLKSKPYIDLTLRVMSDFGMNVPENNNYQSFSYTAKNGNRLPGKEVSYQVEGDWSGGAFLLVAGAIAGQVSIEGLDINSSQADKAVLAAISDSGARVNVSGNQIKIQTAALDAFDFDATDCPDLFPPLVALAAYCNGSSTIKGVSRLAHKESNRGITLQQEFGKMGVAINLENDLMTVYGGGGLKGADVHSHHDHRIAMACAVAALKATSTTTIADADAINKSYPDFYEHMKLLGAVIEKV